jgi:uncharacterized protein (TIGR03382 family)
VLKSALLAAVLAALVLPLSAQASIVWRADFENGGTSQFNGNIQRVSADRLQVVTSPAGEGRYVLQATVQQGDDPINASGNRAEVVHTQGEREGDMYFYRFLVRFDSKFPAPNTWQLFTQWHHTGLTGSPPLEFVVRGEQLEFVHNSPANSTTTRMTLGPLVRGQWQEFILQVKWSPDPAVGFVQVWRNRELKIARRSFATMFPGQGIYMKAGYYRNDTIAQVGTLYLDGYLQTTTLAEAMPATSAIQTGGSTPSAPAPSTSPQEESPTASGTETLSPDPLQDPSATGEPQVGCSASGGSMGLLGLLLLGFLPQRRRRA